MSRLGRFLLCFLSGLPALESLPATPPPSPPNVILILVDDLGATDLAARRPDRVTALQARLDAWRQSVGAQMPSSVNPDFDPARTGQWTH